MCRFHSRDSHEPNSDEENEDLPKVLAAIATMKQRADFALEDIYNMAEIMRKTRYIMSNIVTIHRNIKENSLIALKRIERLTEHMDTYERIVSQIDYTFDIKAELKVFLDQIQEIKTLNERFEDNWLKNETLIKTNCDQFNENFAKIMDHKKCAEEMITKRDYLRITDINVICKTNYKNCKDLDQTCNQWCKESGDNCSDICDKVNHLENTFNQILRQSLDSMEIHRKIKQSVRSSHQTQDQEEEAEEQEEEEAED